jgi:ATP-binding cassette subfamily F protein 3
VVSHDRYLIDALATQVWEIQTDGRVLRVFKGTYSEYRLERQAEEAEEQVETAPIKAQPRKQSQQKNVHRLSKWGIRQNRQRLLAVEMKIIELESKLMSIERRLERPPQNTAEVLRLGETHQEIQAELEKRMTEWGELSELLADNQE